MQPTSRLFRRICEVFDQSDVYQVTRDLDDLTREPGPQTGERLQTAVVMLSHGDMPEFERQVEEARIDWRDVLIAAGLADEDWPQRLDEYLGPAGGG